MKIKIARLAPCLAVAFALWGALELNAQPTAFTYQGRLNDGPNPANGTYDLLFTIYDAVTGGGVQGGPLTNASTSVSGGLFTVTLDFGAGVFSGADRWLEIGVRANGGNSFVALTPRQPLTATPYATRAASASSFTGAVSDGQLSANVARLNANQTFGGTVNFSGGANNFSGTFSGNGAGVTNVNFSTLNTSGFLSWGNFALTASLGTPGPSSVTAANVNGDGKLDLICANSSADTLSVFTNDGSGGFALASSPSVGSEPHSVTAADVNGDGKADLISANYNDNSLSVLTNNGSGGFVLASSPAVGDHPVSVVAADVNGDGKLDLISANLFANTLSVLTNNGSGGFVLASSPGVGNEPSCVTAADVNGDGKVDLISASVPFGTLSVLTNNGSGGFVLSSSPFVGDYPQSVTAVDVNGDGKVDLISANRGFDALSVLTNNGSGGFALASSPSVGAGPGSVAAADVNGDGKVDLISANEYDNTLSVLTNNGSGGFALASSTTVGSGPTSVVAADVNGNGKVDLISANHGDDTLSVLLNLPTLDANINGGSVNAGSVNARTVTWSSGGSLIANQGGSIELGNSVLSGATPFIDFHYGTGDNQDYNVRLINDASNHLSLEGDLQVNGTVTAVSFNGDGSGLTNLSTTNLIGAIADALLPANLVRLDANQTFSGTVNFSSASNSFAGAFSGNGSAVTNVNFETLNSFGVFAWPGTFVSASAPGVGTAPFSVVAADVNGDGKPDLITANHDANTLTVLTNNGSGGFVLSSSPAATGATPYAVTAADVNGDGKADLICANYNSSTLTVLTNDGSGGFVLSSTPAASITVRSVTAADVNGDGKVDLITPISAGNVLIVLTNDGSGGFAASSVPTVGRNPGFVAAADVNGDGKLDLISADFWGSTLTVLTNNGNGGFAVNATLGSGSGPCCVVATDVNGDGKVDLISANNFDNTLAVLTNNGIGTFVFSYWATVTGNPGSLVAADVNGDGKVDLISSGYSENTLTVLTNNGSGTFVLASTPSVGARPNSVAAADVNGDGKVDLISANSSDNTVSVLFNVPALTAGAVNAGGGVSWGAANTLKTDQGGSIELGNSLVYGASPYIDFHFGTTSAQDYNVRLINDASNRLSVSGNFQVYGTLSGNGSDLTTLNASQLTTGTVPNARLSANVPLLSSNQTFSGVNRLTNVANTIAGSFTGSGAGLTSLNASQLSSGTVSDARLSPNVPLLNSNQTFSGVNTLSNVANNFAGSFAGNGAGLTSLNASQLSSGTVPDASLSATVARLNANQTFAGQNTFSNTVSGGGVTLDASSTAGAFNLKNASGIRSSLGLATSAGNYSLDAAEGDTVLRASAGKLLIQNGSAASAITISTNNYVGIGTTNPATPLHVVGPGDVEISVQSTAGSGRRWTVQSSGGATPSLAGTFQIIDRTAGASRLLIDTTGNVLIPGNLTNSGTAVFNGSAMVGTNPVAVGPENLRIVRGTVNANGTIASGSGFSVNKTNTGMYTVTFTTAFADTPAVTATAVTDGVTSLDSLAAGSFGCGIHSGSVVGGNRADRQFSFIAIGAR